MKTIVLEHYPVGKLPEDIQAVLDDSETVRLVIERDPRPALNGEAQYQRLLSDMATWTLDTGGRDSVERVRSVRDEWDD